MEVKLLMTLCLTLFLGVCTTVAQNDKPCDSGYPEDLMKTLRMLEQGSKVDGKILETLIRTLITTKENNDEDDVHRHIMATILNIVMPSSEPIKDHMLNEILGMLVKIGEHLKSSRFPARDFLTFLKVVESEGAYTLEMRLNLLHRFIAYHAKLVSWEIKLMLEFRELLPSTIERKTIKTVIDMVKKDLRPLDIVKYLMLYFPLAKQPIAMEIIRKYEKEAMEHKSGSCGMVNEELYEMVKTMREEIKEIKKKQARSEVMEILKWPGWKMVFVDEHEHYMFKEMAAFIESSYGQKTHMWLQGMLDWMNKEVWAADLLKRILSMINENKNVKETIVKHIMADEKLADFFHKVQYWMKSQDFSKLSPHLQMLHQIISSVKFGEKMEEKKWIDGFFHWLDNTFDKSQEWSKTIKSIARSMVDKTWMYSLREEIDEDMKVRVLIQHGQILCDKLINGRRESIEHILTSVKQYNDKCRVSSVEFYHRESLTGEKRTSKFVYSINKIQGNEYFKWVICIVVKGKIVRMDVDVMYKLKDGEEIHLMYMDPKSMM